MANNATMDGPTPEAPCILLAIPQELRDKILFFALPEAYALPISWDPRDGRQVTPVGLYPKAPYPFNETEEHSYQPIPLLSVSYQIRSESLSVLSHQILLEVCTFEALSALLPLIPDVAPLPTFPRNFHLNIFYGFSLWIPEYVDPFKTPGPTKTRGYCKAWLAQLERLPANTDTVTLDFSHPVAGNDQRERLLDYDKEPLVLVQRGSAKLWRKTCGKVTVNVIGWGLARRQDSTTVLERSVYCPGRKKGKKENRSSGGCTQNFWSVLSDLEVEEEYDEDEDEDYEESDEESDSEPYEEDLDSGGESDYTSDIEEEESVEEGSNSLASYITRGRICRRAV
ncbi:uncharacterized protein BDZ99DRAFT_560847 [Mytilinidion resinicola]|uniref:Uncharacterized protein n=1 Tax=Mytilinidion resinicola TaxID=574789 RepID=A0A6A6YRG3_9PEZI|nr:uncharacterized protein BDZ99DRAFT_560847 [Mytilinidion resinicola]KAF2810624.1 hypothetical protein BDZ99DRAFT_560847 [Mytilinidion resinicola]